jgi:hypothetical protein
VPDPVSEGAGGVEAACDAAVVQVCAAIDATDAELSGWGGGKGSVFGMTGIGDEPLPIADDRWPELRAALGTALLRLVAVPC